MEEFHNAIALYKRQNYNVKAALVLSLLVVFILLAVVAKDLSYDTWKRLIVYSYVISWSVSGLCFVLLITVYFYFRWMASGVEFREENEDERGLTENDLVN